MIDEITGHPGASSRADPALPARERALLELGARLQRLNYRFITPTPATIARVNARAGNERARDLRDVFGWSRPFDATVLPHAMLALMREAGVLQHSPAGYRSTVRVSSLGEQLFFHSAFPTVASDAVFFGPDTYRFARQLHVELPALQGSIRRAADIGCGSGAGAIELARLHPSASVAALDINHAALRLAGVNALLARTPNVTPAYSDMLKAVEGQFDLILSNPPYLVDAEQRAYRHGGGELGAGLSLAVVDAAIARLAPGGTLMLYTASAIVCGADRLRDAVARRLADAGFDWCYEQIDPDIFGEELDTPAYEGADRIAAVWLQARRPNGPE
ncbi:MAG: class I SAM-dependent methyltransferase [Telluria sp.]